MTADYRKVKINGGFWKKIEELNEKVTINAVWNRFDESGRIKAFDFNWKEGMENKPHVYWDSDVFKWLEGAFRILYRNDNKELAERAGHIIDRIEEHREKDGYFNIYYTVCESGKRFTNRDMHELYCAGHLIEAAVTHFETTGSERLLNIAKKYADCIESIFKTEQSASFATPGHEELELALMRLYRATAEKRYLELAKFFIDMRGANDKDNYIMNEPEYAQDNVCPRKMEKAVGHAVRCLYLLCGMADCAHDTDDHELMEACRRVYEDIVQRKMYITGGVGSTSIGEAFTIPYDLPNEKAYAETCAAISLMMFSNRMAHYEKNAKYADTAERAMYNGMMSGISLDGESFFYENPLEIVLKNRDKTAVRNNQEHYPISQRQKVFSCSCCPPNLNRTLSAMGDFIYDVDGDVGYINQFAESEYNDGEKRIVQKTDYPKNGVVRIQADGISTLNIRIPEWCDEFKINKKYTVKNGYAKIVNDGSEVIFEMKMQPVLIEANPEISDDANKASVMYGPIVYCAEAVDNIENLNSLYLSEELNEKMVFDEFFGAYTIEADGFKAEEFDGLYRKRKAQAEKCRIKLIPYYGFANRGESNMCVWLNICRHEN